MCSPCKALSPAPQMSGVCLSCPTAWLLPRYVGSIPLGSNQHIWNSSSCPNLFSLCGTSEINHQTSVEAQNHPPVWQNLSFRSSNIVHVWNFQKVKRIAKRTTSIRLVYDDHNKEAAALHAEGQSQLSVDQINRPTPTRSYQTQQKAMQWWYDDWTNKCS